MTTKTNSSRIAKRTGKAEADINLPLGNGVSPELPNGVSEADTKRMAEIITSIREFTSPWRDKNGYYKAGEYLYYAPVSTLETEVGIQVTRSDFRNYMVTGNRKRNAMNEVTIWLDYQRITKMTPQGPRLAPTEVLVQGQLESGNFITSTWIDTHCKPHELSFEDSEYLAELQAEYHEIRSKYITKESNRLQMLRSQRQARTIPNVQPASPNLDD